MICTFRIELTGRVQGCGVRPALVRAARAHALTGCVMNVGDRVVIVLQGDQSQVLKFTDRLQSFLPTLAQVRHQKSEQVDNTEKFTDFSIVQTLESTNVPGIPEIPPDRGICAACLQELFAPQSRRYLWPFIGCSECGPRYSWLRRLPFIRRHTTFDQFQPCKNCAKEYTSTNDRRFGMELIACAECGPTLYYRDQTTNFLGQGAWMHAVATLQKGGIVALQGFSGFHLLARAADENAVMRLRAFKSRQEKPLAILVDSVRQVGELAFCSETEANWLTGAHRPIVLLKKKDTLLWPWIAPDNPRIGIMLPNNGMQALITRAMGEPLVATSANRRGDAIAEDLNEVLSWLTQGISGICYHDIPLWQVQDDSVLQMLRDGPLFFRRARGFANEVLPAPILAQHSAKSESLLGQSERNCLGNGALLKNTVALRMGSEVLLSQYIGELENVSVINRHEQIKQRLESLCNFRPDAECRDAHPESESDGFNNCRQFEILHHEAHVAALLAEHEISTPALVAAWDGLGYGPDGQWWGSEVYRCDQEIVPAFGLMPFPLPGGDKCAHEPWRVMSALALQSGISPERVRAWLLQLPASGDSARESTARDTRLMLFDSLLSRFKFSQSTSMGRFLEACACRIFNMADNVFEGHLASQLEYSAFAAQTAKSLFQWEMPLVKDECGVLRWQWQAVIRSLWQASPIDFTPHHYAKWLLEGVVSSLLKVCKETEYLTLGVSGGCFQNTYWLEWLQENCPTHGIKLLRPLRLPPNDGAIAYGQVQDLLMRSK